MRGSTVANELVRQARQKTTGRNKQDPNHYEPSARLNEIHFIILSLWRRLTMNSLISPTQERY